MGLQSLYRSIRYRKDMGVYEEDDITTNDVHCRMMRKYKEVPEWWFLIVLGLAIACGMAGVGAWDTYTNPAVVLFGIALALIFVIPVGMISAITGLQGESPVSTKCEYS